MDLIVENPPRSYWLQVLTEPADFELPFGGIPYPCLIWDTRANRSAGERLRLSRTLVASGVRYAVCGGFECEAWHDAVDEAYIELGLEGKEANEKFVMTSLHPDDSIDEVAFFFVGNTNFDNHDFAQFLVLQLGSDWATEQSLREAVREHALKADDEEPEESWSNGAV